MMQMYVDGIGLRGPGLDGWPAGRSILTGISSYVPLPIIVPECELLLPTERRRAVPSVKLAVAVANEAIRSADRDPANLATIFTSAAGDSHTLHEILQVLATSAREVSPTRFHNSVHNAAAGYWHIATGCREASASIACHDASFAAGLLDAASRIVTERQSILLVAYDLPYPAPLDAVRPISGSFGAAFLLAPTATEHSFALIEIALVRKAPSVKPMEVPALETLRAGNPAARSLPILRALARGDSETMLLDYVAGNSLAVSITSRNGGTPASGGAQALCPLPER